MDNDLTHIIDSDRPWLISYERYNIDPFIHMPPADSSLLALFEASFERFADQTAYLDGKHHISYRQLDAFSRNLAGQFQSMGLVRGETVGVILPNVLHYPIIVMAVIRAGLTLVSFNPNYTARELAYQITDSQVRVLVMMDKFMQSFQQLDSAIIEQLRHVVICRHRDVSFGSVVTWGQKITDWLKKTIHYPIAPTKSSKLANTNITWHFFSQLITASKTIYQRPTLGLDDSVLIQYTGGTTGIAKGAVLTHGNLIANLLQIDNLLRSAYDDEDASAGDTVLTALPLYHVFTFTIGCMLVIFRGFTGLLVVNPKDITRLITLMKIHPPSFILGVNPLFSGLLKHPAFSQLDFSTIKATIGGGMAISSAIAKHWHQVTGVPIIEGYGLSETSPVATFNPLTIAEFTNKVGIPAPATDIILIDENDRPVAIGERGEMVIKGRQVMQGYYNRPQDTRNAFTKNGYFRTGDIAIMDERGFIKIVDRKKDMLVVSGFNVYPSEIETVMNEHPSIIECAVIGVPNPIRGEEPKIFIVSSNPHLTAEAIIEFGKKNLTGYQRPRHVTFVESLPKSSVGKILRRELRKREGLE